MGKLEEVLVQFEKAVGRLSAVLLLPESDVIRDSAIQRFEFCMDLAWKVVKTYLEEKKGVICHSPKDAFRQAYQQGLIGYDEEWLEMVDMRNKTAHTYDEETAEEVFSELDTAETMFWKLAKKLKE